MRLQLVVTSVGPAVAAVVLVACGGSAPTSSTASTSTPPTATVTSVTPSKSPSGSASPTPTGHLDVPVYWVGATPQGPRLFREFSVASPATVGPAAVAATAVDVMLHGAAADPAYHSGWPAGTNVATVSRHAATLFIALDVPVGSVPTASSLAVQQLVYTATAAQPGTQDVTLRLRSSAAAMTLHHVGRAPESDVIAPIWIIDPQWGATVSGSRITVTGTASVFEAQFAWQVRRDDHLVASGTAFASVGVPQRGTFRFVTPKLPAGTYVIVAYDRSMSDGSIYAVDRAQVTLAP